MAYIMFLNPLITGRMQGMDKGGGVRRHPGLASAFATLIMALYANYPIRAGRPAMGINAFSPNGVGGSGLHYSWQAALAARFSFPASCFLILSLTPLARNGIIGRHPEVAETMANRRRDRAVSGAILALKGAGGDRAGQGGTYVTLGNLHAAGRRFLAGKVGFIAIGALEARRVPGADLDRGFWG